MRVLRSPVLQFLLAGLLVLVVVVLATGSLIDRAAADEAVNDAKATTELLARSVVEPALPRGMASGDQGAVDRFDRTVLKRVLVDDVKRIKLWDADGTVVYSDTTALIGQQFQLGDEALRVLDTGVSEAEESDLTKPENRFETDASGGLLEVYTRVTSPEGEPLLFEVYYSAADVEARRAQVLSRFRPITVGGLLALLVITTPLVWVLTRRVRSSSRERERLLRAAVSASDGERRRIARDLHDSVVQDLAGTAFELSASALHGRDAQQTMLAQAEVVRRSLRALRSLMVEIQPPDLGVIGLKAALDDLVAPAAAAGVDAQVTVTGLEHLHEDDVALVWRVAQEAVRNALRHSGATRLRVVVAGTREGVRLEVSDDGIGFDRQERVDRTHFGLEGMAGLVDDAGGRLEVDSAPGQGTTIRLDLVAAGGAR